jgi:GTP cyclohydrolase I
MKVTWAEVFERLEVLKIQLSPTARVWGVPRGGQVVAGLLDAAGAAKAVDDVHLADVIIDDIVDSGMTKARFAGNGRPFLTLIDKPKEDLLGKWVTLPWDDTAQGPDDAVVRLLQFIGENPTRDGLRDTPKRVLKAWRDMTVGYLQDPAIILNRSFEQPHDELVVLRGTRFTSVCEHHLLPFSGTAAVGYIPTDRVVGISKLARLVECFARRLQIQERMTQQIADAIMAHLKPLGVGVIIRATHSCMSCRGVMQPESEMVTSMTGGLLRDDSRARAEFLSLVTL